MTPDVAVPRRVDRGRDGGPLRISQTNQQPTRSRNMRLQRIVTAGLGLVLALTLLGGTAHAAKAQPVGKVNINSASAQQLETLPGVGPKLAARIVEYRQKSGGFKSAQELMNVKGIGEKNFEKLQAFVTASGEASKVGGKAAMEAPKSSKASPEAAKDDGNR